MKMLLIIMTIFNIANTILALTLFNKSDKSFIYTAIYFILYSLLVLLLV